MKRRSFKEAIEATIDEDALRATTGAPDPDYEKLANPWVDKPCPEALKEAGFREVPSPLDKLKWEFQKSCGHFHAMTGEMRVRSLTLEDDGSVTAQIEH